MLISNKHQSLSDEIVTLKGYVAISKAIQGNAVSDEFYDLYTSQIKFIENRIEEKEEELITLLLGAE